MVTIDYRTMTKVMTIITMTDVVKVTVVTSRQSLYYSSFLIGKVNGIPLF